MSDEDKQGVSNAQIMHSIGQLTGSVQALHQGLTARIEDMRADIRRLDQASNDRMNRIEDNLAQQIAVQGDALNKRIDGLETNVGDKISGLGTRVAALEDEDKKIIEKVAKLSALGGGVGGALAAAAVELIKHIPH
ncbi:MAG: hypothetical protein PHH47_12935 [Gallionella sp.]|nr:hypothetical protein [Gallionella sp.]MDD4947593.1 hypothetical protein [Gallionella sp.]MDD5612889.1 hypothetical protein [Gallionella sp.]